jgi:hypothetical protein
VSGARVWRSAQDWLRRQLTSTRPVGWLLTGALVTLALVGVLAVVVSTTVAS